MTRKRILFVATEFASGMIPFAATIINTLGNNESYDIYCLCVNSGKHTYLGLINNNINAQYIEYPQNKIIKLTYKIWPFAIIRMLRKMEREINPDYVHFLTGEFTLANYLFFHNKRNYCYMVHDLHPHETSHDNWYGRLFEYYILWCNKRIRSEIGILTTSSVSQYEELKAMYERKKIKFTHFPSLVNESIANGSVQIKEIIGNEPYLLFFGSVNVYKGVDLLIEAFKKSALYKTHKLVIAGRGIAYNNITDDNKIIRINRFIYDNEVRILFVRASFIVYPYRSATMSGVLSIAFYFHKYVILSDIPFFRDNECKLTTFFNNGDVEDLVDKLNNIEGMAATDVQEHCYDDIYSKETLIGDFVSVYS